MELRARNGSGRESDVLATYASHLRLRRYAVFQGHTVDGDGGAPPPPPRAHADARASVYGDATAPYKHRTIAAIGCRRVFSVASNKIDPLKMI